MSLRCGIRHAYNTCVCCCCRSRSRERFRRSISRDSRDRYWFTWTSRTVEQTIPFSCSLNSRTLMLLGFTLSVFSLDVADCARTSECSFWAPVVDFICREQCATLRNVMWLFETTLFIVCCYIYTLIINTKLQFDASFGL